MMVAIRRHHKRFPPRWPDRLFFFVERIHAVSARLFSRRAEQNQKLRSGSMKSIMKFLNDESGIETLEYAVVGAIVAAVALLIYGSGWGGSVQNTLINAAASATKATL